MTVDKGESTNLTIEELLVNLAQDDDIVWGLRGRLLRGLDRDLNEYTPGCRELSRTDRAAVADAADGVEGPLRDKLLEACGLLDTWPHKSLKDKGTSKW